MGANREQKISVNGVQTNASVSVGWNDVSFTGTLTSLTIGPTQLGSSSNIGAIEIDGVMLIDNSTEYGQNGFHLDFADNSSDAALGYDAAGSNDWTVNNLSANAVTTGALSFDGDDLMSSTSTIANPGTGDYCLELWAKSNTTSGTRRWVGTSLGALGGQLNIRAWNNQIEAYSGSSYFGYTPSNGVAELHHICLLYTSDAADE